MTAARRGVFFRERTTASALATMGIAIIGVMMIGWGDFGLSGQAMLGDILSVLSVIAVVGYLLIGQSTVKMMSHWLYSFCVFMFAAEFFTIDNIVTNTTFLSYSRLDWSMFVLLATVPTLSHLINNWLLNDVNATTISMSILGEPVVAATLAFLLLRESLTGMKFLAVSLY